MTVNWDPSKSLMVANVKILAASRTVQQRECGRILHVGSFPRTSCAQVVEAPMCPHRGLPFFRTHPSTAAPDQGSSRLFHFRDRSNPPRPRALQLALQGSSPSPMRRTFPGFTRNRHCHDPAPPLECRTRAGRRSRANICRHGRTLGIEPRKPVGPRTRGR
jgi:hypothetical protein